MLTFSWLVLLIAACGLMVLGRWLAPKDDVYAIAVCSVSVLLGLWGLAIAPISIPIVLGLLTLGWIQVKTVNSQAGG
ncbi:MAG: hypothetical protein IGR76_16405 [Synechococcales cyanobacterium T60_A2020_003]|nr:hypothetical protein [Synechococcales cyanobacterium T60_A2020_003]